MSVTPSLNKITISATGAIHDLAEQKKRAGIMVHDLSVGEPILLASEWLAEQAAQAVRHGQTRYAPIAGLPVLRQAASNWLNQIYGTDYTVEQTLVTAGGKFGLYLLGQTLLKPGDEALVITPYWVSYPTLAALAGAEPRFVVTRPETGFKASAADIAKVCTAKTKLLFLNSAANPTGVVYGREELAAILALAKAKNFLVISDEVYSGLTYEGEYVSCGSFPEYREQVAVVQSCSKNFAMTGWRVGFVFAAEPIIKTLTALQSQTITGTSTVSQAVATTVLGQAESLNRDVRERMKTRRAMFVSEFNRLFKQSLVPPTSALYAFIPLTAFGKGGQDAGVFCRQALEECNVAMVPGDEFGQAGYVRCSFGIPESEIKEALQALTKNIGLL